MKGLTSPTVLANFFFGLFFQNSILQQARQLVKKPLLSRTRLSFGGGARGGGSPPRVGSNAMKALHGKAFSERSEDFSAAVRRESNGIFAGRSVGQLVQQDRQLLQLFLRLPALHRLPDAAVHVGLEHHAVGLFQNGLGGHELVGHVQAVPVLLNHLEDAVDLSPGGLQQAGDLGVVRLHWMDTTS